MKNKSLLLIKALLLGAFFCTLQGFGQNEGINWYFGAKAGLRFTTYPPTVLTNGQLSTIEGCATISDGAGNLLFYTDGLKVWNNTHVVMPNGSGLLGSNSSTQSAIAIKRPGSPNRYFVFTSAADAGVDGLRYNEIDMTLNGGLGDIIVGQKNILLQTPTCEKITAVKHCNGIDTWVISHDWGNNKYRTYLVTNAGVNPVPVVSSTGWTVTAGTAQACYGQLKANVLGNKLAAVYYIGGDRVEYGNFDNNTGIVSGMSRIDPGEPGAYGCEFSPDSRFLYVTTNQGKLAQYYLCAANITSTRVQIANTGPFMGSLQLTQQGYIMVSRGSAKWSGVIKFPNNPGAACVFQDAWVNYTVNGNFGLPTLPSYIFQPNIDSLHYTTACKTVSFTDPLILYGCQNIPYSSILYDFGDGTLSSSGNPFHIYPNSGVYIVNVVIQVSCYTFTRSYTITVLNNNTVTVGTSP